MNRHVTSQRTKPRQAQAFTLIELLIVVAIIAVLASIAVSNFLEAQARAKVSRAQSDLRALATALESYRIDNNRYPPTPMDQMGTRDERMAFLTTPVAYISSIPREVFERDKPDGYAFWSAKLNDAMKVSPVYAYLPQEGKVRGRWALFSRAPDLDYEVAVEEGGMGLLMYYDSTNGTSSNGDVMRFGP